MTPSLRNHPAQRPGEGRRWWERQQGRSPRAVIVSGCQHITATQRLGTPAHGMNAVARVCEPSPWIVNGSPCRACTTQLLTTRRSLAALADRNPNPPACTPHRAAGLRTRPALTLPIPARRRILGAHPRARWLGCEAPEHSGASAISPTPPVCAPRSHCGTEAKLRHLAGSSGLI